MQMYVINEKWFWKIKKNKVKWELCYTKCDQLVVDGCFFFWIVANENIYCVAQSYIM